MGDLKTIRSDVPNLMNDVPNFDRDVPSVPKCILRGGSAPNHFPMGFHMKLWIIHVQMRVPEAIGWDVPNLMKNVPNLMKDVPNFVKDVPRVSKCVPKWGSTPNNFLMGS